MAAGISCRNPALLAKMIATLDVLSQGRVDVGMGAGWYEPEYAVAGIEFDGTVLRYAEIERVGDGLRLLRLGECDFPFEPFSVLRDGDEEGLDILQEALGDVYHGSQADVSAGKNRWSTVQDFAIVKGFGESSFVEGVAEFEFFGNNKNYYGQTLKKDTAIRLMALVSTNLTEKTYVGLRYRYETGGREKVNGETTVTRARNHQLAAEITHQLTDAHQVQLQYIHDLKVENGPRMRGLQFRYAYAF